MKNIRKSMVAYPFVVVPMLFVIATILMDIAMYSFMGLAFPGRYHFSIIVMLVICSLLFLVKKPGIQLGICIFLLVVHFAVAVSNIILHSITREVVSLEHLSAARQASSLMDHIVLNFWHMFTFSLILVAFICVSVWCFSQINQGRLESRGEYNTRKPYRKNLIWSIALISLMAYSTAWIHNVSMPEISDDPHMAFEQRNDDYFNYITFTNRTNVFARFGTYSYYWTNLSFLLGFKKDFQYDIQGEWVDGFTYEMLPWYQRNLIMLQMEAIEHQQINPWVMPNLFNFLYGDRWDDVQNRPHPLPNDNIVGLHGYHAIDRTEFAEFGALTGTLLDGISMTSMPQTVTPFALPNVLRNNERLHPYQSITAFHNYFAHMYNRDILYNDGFGFKSFVAPRGHANTPFVTDMGIPTHDTFNHNSDFLMFYNWYEEMAPQDKKFFSHINNVATHMPTRITDNILHLPIFEYDRMAIEYNIDELEKIFVNLTHTNAAIRNATKSLLVSAHNYDRGLGLLFDQLKKPALDEYGNQKLCINGTPLTLMDTTTIVMFSDHGTYDMPNIFAPVIPNSIYPEVAGAQGRMLVFYVHSPAIHNPHIIEKFATYFDIYSTITDLFHIRTNTKFTLGISIFDERENVGFSQRTNLVYTRTFATYDFVTPLPLSTEPLEYEKTAIHRRVSYKIAVMTNLRPLFRGNQLRDIGDAHFIIVGLPPQTTLSQA